MESIYGTFMTSGFVVSLVTIISWWILFNKAGYKGWYAIVPIYNVYTFCQMVTGSGWFFLAMLIPFVNVFVLIYLLYRLSLVFGHGILFTLGLVFMEPLFILILALGASSYHSNTTYF